MNLSRFFTLDELTFSPTAQAEGIPNQPTASEVESLRALCTAMLDPLREAIGQPIKVNSGYRGPALNQRINGAMKSQHLNGQAADIQCAALSVLELFKTVIRLKLPFDQVIYEVKGASKWVHLSHDPAGTRREIRLARFDASGKATYPLIAEQEALDMSEPVSRSASAMLAPTYMETADEPPEVDIPMKTAPAKKIPAKTTLAPKSPAKTSPARKAGAKPAMATRKSPPRKK